MNQSISVLLTVPLFFISSFSQQKEALSHNSTLNQDMMKISNSALNSAKGLSKTKPMSGFLSQSASGVSQKQIDSFWADTRRSLATIPMDAKITPVKEALPYAKYKIELKSLGGVTVAAYLSLPVQGESHAKPWPVIVTVPGYDGNQQGIMLSECQRGYAILQVFPRGQGISAPYYTLTEDKLGSISENPQGAYYQGAYMDVIRMIDYIVTRTDVIDTTHIAIAATSQGGGISLAVASLDNRIKAVVAHVPFLCNFRMAANMPSLVRNLLNKANKNKEPYLSSLEYFDPLNLVTHLHVPVLVSMGGKDHTCPKETIESVFKKIPSRRKSLKYYPGLPHTTCLDFYQRTWPWLDKNFL